MYSWLSTYVINYRGGVNLQVVPIGLNRFYLFSCILIVKSSKSSTGYNMCHVASAPFSQSCYVFYKTLKYWLFIVLIVLIFVFSCVLQTRVRVDRHRNLDRCSRRKGRTSPSTLPPVQTCMPNGIVSTTPRVSLLKSANRCCTIASEYNLRIPIHYPNQR